MRRYLVLGDASRQYALVDRPGTPVVVAELEADAGGPRAVEYLPAAGTIARRIAVAGDAWRDVPELRVWSGCHPHEDLQHYLDDPELAWTLTPLAVLRCDDDGLTEVLMSSRLRKIGALFTRVARFPSEGGDVWSLVRHAFELSTAFHAEVSIEWQEFTVFERGTEIESKIGLTDPVPIWSLASRLSTLVGTDVLPGFVPDVGNEVQRWEMHQQTCEVLAPPDRRGYIALSRQPTGAYLKHKQFAEDTLRRTESITRLDDDLTGSLAAYLGVAHPELTIRELSPISRTRFDVNVESAETGHTYGIEIDEVIEQEHGHVLRQIEVEYQRSRIHDGLEPGSIVPELERLTALLESYLNDCGIGNIRNYYSKLSFLRDCAAGTYLSTGRST